MNHAIKLGRLSLQSPILCSSSGLSSVTGKKGVGSVRFVQVNSSGNDDPNKQSNFRNMDNNTNKKDEQQDNNLNVMKESFGEGYSTRSDDEGFGGIYGGNDEGNAEMKVVQDPAHHDNDQGSEVKEKEKSRNQK
ncbi:uncharacterized protein [Spinacia oleracea]|uniref:Uncharacterized protein n=1 Tax=Spinacia oleracea TaxID=3562 RepID=A0A9R0JVS7_SPIOL|nr:uncharacterized protein LOC110788625 [Spinacia oleracea]